MVKPTCWPLWTGRRATESSTEHTVKFSLYIADRFEAMQNGKLLAVGLFADKTVVLNAALDAPDPTLELPFGVPLSILLSLHALDSQEQLRGSCSVYPPGDLPAVATLPIDVDLSLGPPAINVIATFDLLAIPAIGHYRVTVEVGGQTFSDGFEIQLRRMANAPPWPVGPKIDAMTPAPAKKAKRKRRNAPLKV